MCLQLHDGLSLDACCFKFLGVFLCAMIEIEYYLWILINSFERNTYPSKWHRQLIVIASRKLLLEIKVCYTLLRGVFSFLWNKMFSVNVHVSWCCPSPSRFSFWPIDMFYFLKSGWFLFLLFKIFMLVNGNCGWW